MEAMRSRSRVAAEVWREPEYEGGSAGVGVTVQVISICKSLGIILPH